MVSPLTIDGSTGEGGGQILRTALALSAVTRQPFRMHSIRARRPKPGLAAQHLACVRAVAAVCEATVRGAHLQSREIEFRPGMIQGGRFLFDVAAESASAGATGLVLQSVLPALLFAGEPSEVMIRGGTHVPWAPHFHYLEHVFRPALEHFGVRFSLELTRAGWYPRGEGQLKVRLHPVEELTGVRWAERPREVDLTCRGLLSNLPNHIAVRETNAAQARLKSHGHRAQLVTEDLPSVGKGTLCFAHTAGHGGGAGATSFGELRKRAEVVGDQAGRSLLQYLKSKAAVGPYLADQLALPCALARGESTYTTSQVTLHLTTVLTVIRQFLSVRAEVTGKEGEPGLVSIPGVGFRSR